MRAPLGHRGFLGMRFASKPQTAVKTLAGPRICKVPLTVEPPPTTRAFAEVYANAGEQVERRPYECDTHRDVLRLRDGKSDSNNGEIQEEHDPDGATATPDLFQPLGDGA